ncbi:hypothetical protein HDU82_009169 [Entophlyctis luteolus]|nr:hypothetical protein HDU82_009169 [Entophlyctis luteolus]
MKCLFGMKLPEFVFRAISTRPQLPQQLQRASFHATRQQRMTSSNERDAAAAAAAAKSDKAKEREARAEQARLEKLAKFEAKQKKLAEEKAKQQAQPPKQKEKVEKKEKTSADDSAGTAIIADVTPEGQKKNLSLPYAQTYNPALVEAAWYSWWEKSGFFKPEMVNGKPKYESMCCDYEF